MLLLAVIACREPEYIDPPGDRSPSESATPESTADSVPPTAGEWSDPIVGLGEMDVVNNGMELTDAALGGDWLYLSGQQQQGQGGLWVVDLADPTAPTQVAQGNFRNMQYVCYDETTAWGISRNNNLMRATVQDSSLQVKSWSVDSGGDIDCDADHVAWAARTDGVYIMANDGDWNTGEALNLEGDWRGVLLSEDVIWTAGVGEIARWDMDGNLLGEAAVDGWCQDMQVSDGTLAVACGADGVHLLNAEDLSLLGTWSGHVSARTVAWDGHRIWLAAWSELLLLDASDPAAVTLIGSEPATSSVMGVVADGEGLAWVADWRNPFTVRRDDVLSPEARVSPSNAVPGDRVSLINDGPETLWFEAPELGVTPQLLGPGERTAIDIPEDFEYARVPILTDDPDESEVEIEIGSMSGLALGEAAPDFAEYDLEGTLWELQSLRGEVVWLATFNDG